MTHKHADLMMQYALDAAETDKPWERWEYCVGLDVRWDACTKHPEWVTVHEYRRKPSQEQIDKEAFSRWWNDSFDVERLTLSDAWFTALEWERNRS